MSESGSIRSQDDRDESKDCAAWLVQALASICVSGRTPVGVTQMNENAALWLKAKQWLSLDAIERPYAYARLKVLENMGILDAFGH